MGNIKILKEGSAYNFPQRTWLIDSSADLANVPNPAQGDICELPDGTSYMYTSAGSWQVRSSGGGGGSDLPPVSSEDNGKVLSVVDGAWGTAFNGSDIINLDEYDTPAAALPTILERVLDGHPPILCADGIYCFPQKYAFDTDQNDDIYVDTFIWVSEPALQQGSRYDKIGDPHGDVYTIAYSHSDNDLQSFRYNITTPYYYFETMPETSEELWDLLNYIRPFYEFNLMGRIRLDFEGDYSECSGFYYFDGATFDDNDGFVSFSSVDNTKYFNFFETEDPEHPVGIEYYSYGYYDLAIAPEYNLNNLEFFIENENLSVNSLVYNHNFFDARSPYKQVDTWSNRDSGIYSIINLYAGESGENDTHLPAYGITEVYYDEDQEDYDYKTYYGNLANIVIDDNMEDNLGELFYICNAVFNGNTQIPVIYKGEELTYHGYYMLDEVTVDASDNITGILLTSLDGSKSIVGTYDSSEDTYDLNFTTAPAPAPVDPRLIITDEDFESPTAEADIGARVVAAYQADPYTDVIWNITEGSMAAWSGRYYIKRISTGTYNLFTLYGLDSNKLIRLYFNEDNNELSFWRGYQIEDGTDIHINVEEEYVSGTNTIFLNGTGKIPYTYAEFSALMANANNKTITGRLHGNNTDYCIIDQARYSSSDISIDPPYSNYASYYFGQYYDYVDQPYKTNWTEGGITDPRGEHGNSYMYCISFDDTTSDNFGVITCYYSVE